MPAFGRVAPAVIEAIHQAIAAAEASSKTIGRSVTVAGTPISRSVVPAGVGTSARRSSSWSSAASPSSTAGPFLVAERDARQQALKVVLGLQELALAGGLGRAEVATSAGHCSRKVQVQNP